MWVWNLVCYIRQSTETENVEEQIKEESIGPKKAELTFFLAQQRPVGQSLIIHEISRSHTQRRTTVGRTSVYLVAETSTWKNTTPTTDKHQCPQWDSNPQSQVSDRRPAP